ncbi:hypothetical protein HED60_23695 [Planctomycetales bacterium ZRK34]|nr:hypothetical protein HED60_23695 [Planctomycetales bacterium ZRK34]
MNKPLATIALAVVAVLGVASIGWAAAPSGDAPTRHAYRTDADYGCGDRYVRHDGNRATRWESRRHMCDHNWFTRAMPWHRDDCHRRADRCD